MKRLAQYSVTVMGMMAAMGWGTVFAGEASTSAWANNGLGRTGTAGATAAYDGNGGEGFARTRTDTAGGLSIGRGIAVGFDGNGLDVSFSHALAPVLGPAYAGTFNMSIGATGQVSTSYGGTLALGGAGRSVEAGGTTRSDRHGGGTAVAHATGNTVGGGRVEAWTGSRTTGGVRPISVVRTRMGR